MGRPQLLPPGPALTRWCGEPGSGEEVELAGVDVLAAASAVEVRPHVPSAAGVECQPGWALGGGIVVVAPLHERDQGRGKLAPFFGQHVVGTAPPLGVRAALEHALLA